MPDYPNVVPVDFSTNALLDCHVHFWNYDVAKPEFSWIGEGMHAIKKSFLPENLIEVAPDIPTFNCIAVQAAQSWQETEFLINLAKKYTFIKGVVGWVDISKFNFLSSILDSLLLKGFRHIIQDKPFGYMSSDAFRYFIASLAKYNFTYDLLIKPHQLHEAYELVQEFPQQKFVIDHMAKPDFRTGDIDGWKEDIQAFRHYPNVFCKVSGLVTETYWENWNPKDFKQALDIVFNTFGTSRVMFGSDWPVCLLAATYHEVYEIVTDFISQLNKSERDKVLYNNAANFYNVMVDQQALKLQ